MSGGERRAGTPRRAAWPYLRERGPALAWRALELARTELVLLTVICVVGAGLLVFLTLAGNVREGETAAFDEAVMLALRNADDLSDPIGPLWLEGVMRDITALGSQLVLSLMTLSVVGYLLLAGKRGAALLVFVSVAGGALLGDLLKLLFQRPRPDLVPHGVDVFTASFPSNHAMLSAVTYLTLGALLARLEKRRRLKLYFLSISVIVTMLVGLSRVYFGVHWPSDVIAGWSVGAAWAMGVWLVALLLQRRGKVEPPTQDSP